MGQGNLSNLTPLPPLPVLVPIESLPSATISFLETPDPDRSEAEAACRSGDTARAKRSIERLQQANPSLEGFGFCLQAAVETGNGDLVKHLLAKGVPISSSLVTSAIETRSTDFLSLFLEHGWDMNQEEAWCVPPPLSQAIVHEAEPSMISWFLDNGADPNATCQMGNTPLSTAVEMASPDIVRQILDYCPDDTVFRGELLHIAARRSDEDAIEIVELLLRRCRFDINARMYEHYPLGYESFKVGGLGTPLHEAAKRGRADVAKLLLRAGVDDSYLDSCHKTALERAELKQNGAVAEVLRVAWNNPAQWRIC